MRKLFWLILALSLIPVGVISCQEARYDVWEDSNTLVESPVLEIPLIGPASESRAEISGMAWCGTDLILLPQYPDRFSEEGSDHVFAISQEKLSAFIDGESGAGIEPEMVPFDAGGLEDTIPGFEGFEAIVFAGDRVYVTIEARQGDEMMGYIVIGEVTGDCAGFTLNLASVQWLQPQADLRNYSHETLVFYQDQVYAYYEANGLNVNPKPVAHVFDAQLGTRYEIRMENIEYRVTDATAPDEMGVFWVINYLFPEDAKKLQPAIDPIIQAYGIGASHRDSQTIERLIQLKINQDGILLVDEPPIYLELLEEDSRNWEGIVSFGDGFLLVTDKFPRTILGYVEPPKED